MRRLKRFTALPLRYFQEAQKKNSSISWAHARISPRPAPARLSTIARWRQYQCSRKPAARTSHALTARPMWSHSLSHPDLCESIYIFKYLLLCVLLSFAIFWEELHDSITTGIDARLNCGSSLNQLVFNYIRVDAKWDVFFIRCLRRLVITISLLHYA